MIEEVEFRGALNLLYINVGGKLIKVYVTRGEAEILNIKVGKRISLNLISSQVNFYPVV